MAMGEQSPIVGELAAELLDAGAPIERRIGALFSLRNILTEDSAAALAKGMQDPSALLAHEAAFALGQMGIPSVVPALTCVLQDESLHPIVRHEAAEALGNLGGERTLDLLRQYLDDPAPEVRETCQLAVHRLAAIQSSTATSRSSAATEHSQGQSGSASSQTAESDSAPVGAQEGAVAAKGQERSAEGETGAALRGSPSATAEESHHDAARPSGDARALEEQEQQEHARRLVGVDPAVGMDHHAQRTTPELREALMSEVAALPERYGALFVLRDRALEQSCPAAAAAIIETLQSCSSALLQHEVAYVLGQLQDTASVSALSAALSDPSVHPMVRHEAAVALGSVADPSSVELLTALSTDPEPIVAESCKVALDMMA